MFKGGVCDRGRASCRLRKELQFRRIGTFFFSLIVQIFAVALNKEEKKFWELKEEACGDKFSA